MPLQPAPLNSTFAVVSIVGFLISALYLWTIAPKWAAAFAILFFIMLIASLVSMSRAPEGGQLKK